MPDEAFREFERLFEESDIMSFRMKVLDLAEVTYKAVMENGTRVCKVHYREVTSENPLPGVHRSACHPVTATKQGRPTAVVRRRLDAW